MTAFLMARAGKLTEIQQAVRGYIREGGSLAFVLLVLLGLIGGVLLVHYLTLRQNKSERRTHHPDPQMLFRDLQGKLALTPSQRQLLDRVARDLNLENPAVLLLSSALFDRHVNAWQSRRGRAGIGKPESPQLPDAAGLRKKLFPIS